MEEKLTVYADNVKRFLDFCGSVLSSPEPNLSKGYLDGKYKIITMLWSKIDIVKDKIMETDGISAEAAEQTKKEYERAFNMLDKVTIRIHQKLEKLASATASNPPPLQLPENLVLNMNKSNLKLKPIEIPMFSGEYKSWISFKNMFDSLIHKNDEFSDLQKMHYLKSCLSDKAERLLSQFDVTEQSYKSAYDTLTERYQNDVILVDSHIVDMLAQPDLTTETSEGIKALMDVTTENLRALKGLKIDTSTWDPILLLLLVQKLDLASRRLWEQTLKPKIRPTIEEFFNFLNVRFNALGCQQKFKFSIGSSTSGIHFQGKINDDRNTHKISHQCCPVCSDDNHSIFTCEKFRNANQQTRAEMAYKAKLCERCLRSHKLDFTQQEGCRVCGENHHTFLHHDR